MRWFTAFFLSLAASAAFASDWRFVTTTQDNQMVFVDLDSAKFVGGEIRVWSGNIKGADFIASMDANRQLVIKARAKVNEGYIPYVFSLSTWKKAIKTIDDPKEIINLSVMEEVMANELFMDFESKAYWVLRPAEGTFACLGGMQDGKPILAPTSAPRWAPIPPDSQIEMILKVVQGLCKTTRQ